MTGPSYHGRTHGPGGTDPIPVTASLPSFAICDMTGVGSISLPTGTATNIDLAGGDFNTNDATLFTLVADTGASGVSSISIHGTGAYRVDAGVSVTRGTTGMTLAQAQATWVGIQVKQDGTSPHDAVGTYGYVPAGGYGFVDPFGAGGYWWSLVTTWYFTIGGTNTDLTTHPIYLTVRHNSGFASMSIDGCAMSITKVSDTPFT